MTVKRLVLLVLFMWLLLLLAMLVSCGGEDMAPEEPIPFSREDALIFDEEWKYNPTIEEYVTGQGAHCIIVWYWKDVEITCDWAGVRG